MFISNALIGLREGLEAALVVVILVAFLIKTERTLGLRTSGSGSASPSPCRSPSARSSPTAPASCPSRPRSSIGGTASIIAVVFVTSMVFWMKSASRTISGELKGQLDQALDVGPCAIALVAFLGVGREGLETAIFFYATTQAAGAGNNQPLLGWIIGLAGAVGSAWLIYRGALKIDLGEFFRWTGSRCPRRRRHPRLRRPRPAGSRLPARPHTLAFDVPAPFRPVGWYAALLKGISTSPRQRRSCRQSRGCSTSASSDPLPAPGAKARVPACPGHRRRPCWHRKRQTDDRTNLVSP